MDQKNAKIVQTVLPEIIFKLRTHHEIVFFMLNPLIQGIQSAKTTEELYTEFYVDNFGMFFRNKTTRRTQIAHNASRFILNACE